MIIVCGEALIDVVRTTDGSRRATPGGGPFNTARALARLGVPAAFVGRLSEDRSGTELAGLLKADGVSLRWASVGPEPTTIAVADVDSAGVAEYRFQVEGTSAPNLTEEMLPHSFGPGVDAVHVGTLGLVLEPMATTLIELVRRERDTRVVMLDPNIRAGLVPDDRYRERIREAISNSTIVKASDSDLAWLYPDLTYKDASDKLLRSGVRLVVVTLGARGAYGAHAAHRVQVEAVPVDVSDTIGAGDAFGAALMAWLHDQGRLQRDLSLDADALRAALEYACLAAAITCTRAGANPPWKREMIAAGQD